MINNLYRYIKLDSKCWVYLISNGEYIKYACYEYKCYMWQLVSLFVGNQQISKNYTYHVIFMILWYIKAGYLILHYI